MRSISLEVPVQPVPHPRSTPTPRSTSAVATLLAAALAAAPVGCTFSPPTGSGGGGGGGADARAGDAAGDVDGPAVPPVDGPPQPIDANLDLDGDGVLDSVDNCPIANAMQFDADADGIGDACDPTCNPGGIGLPRAFGPELAFQIQTPLVNGVERPNVAPGSTVNVTLGYTLRQTVECPACVSQLYWGLKFATEPAACEHDDIVPDGGTTSTSSGSVIAPSASGLYYLRGDWGWDFECEDVQFLDDPTTTDDNNTEFAAFCVIDPR